MEIIAKLPGELHTSSSQAFSSLDYLRNTASLTSVFDMCSADLWQAMTFMIHSLKGMRAFGFEV